MTFAAQFCLFLPWCHTYFIHLSTGNKEDNKWREHWMKTKDAKSTLEAMPRHKRTSAENQLLNGLASVKKADPFQALLFVSVPGQACFAKALYFKQS